jgi:hypothetical protein
MQREGFAVTYTPTEQWILDAEAMLSQLDPTDPRFAAGFAEWYRRVREYKQEELCHSKGAGRAERMAPVTSPNASAPNASTRTITNGGASRTRTNTANGSTDKDSTAPVATALVAFEAA